MRGIALVRVSVHDLHSGRYRFDLTSLQYGVTGRLQNSDFGSRSSLSQFVDRDP